MDNAMLMLAVVVTCVIYKLTHYEDMSDSDIFTICLVNVASWIVLMMLADAFLG